MSKTVASFFIKLVILLFLSNQSYANNYSIEEYESTDLSPRDYCETKFPILSTTEFVDALNLKIKQRECRTEVIFESKILGITTTKNLACNYSIEDARKTCVCKKIKGNSSKFYQLDKVLNETQCKKAQTYVNKKRQKITEKCIKKAGKMKSELAYKDMLNSCLRKNIPGKVLN